jgi:hypothetical protein
MTAAPAPVRARRIGGGWLVPAGLLIALVVALGAIVLLSRRVGSDDVRPEPPAFTYQPATPFQRLTVKQSTAGVLELAADPVAGGPPPAQYTLSPSDSTKVEVLVAVDQSALGTGQWVAIVGVPNVVRNFSIHAIIIIPFATAPDASHIAHSPAGFAGYEASPDDADRVVLGGTVTALADGSLTLAGPAGPLTITLTPDAPLFRLEPATATAVHQGDHVAAVGLAASTPPSALLAQP